MFDKLSPTAVSNLFCMGTCAPTDAHQQVPAQPSPA